MHIGVVSDTHDDLERTRDAIETFESMGVEAVVHCGDVIAPFTAELFDAAFDFYAVCGNNDGEWALSETISSFGTYCGEFGKLTLDETDIAVYHGTSEPIVDALLACGSYEYVCRGHTHERVLETCGDTVHLNPGGLPIPGKDNNFFIATIDTVSDTVEHHLIG